MLYYIIVNFIKDLLKFIKGVLTYNSKLCADILINNNSFINQKDIYYLLLTLTDFGLPKK